MKTLILLLGVLVLSVCSSSYGQMNGYVAIQSPNGGVFYAPRAGTPMYPVAVPAVNNFYGGGVYQRTFYQPQFYQQQTCYQPQFYQRQVFYGSGCGGGRVYGNYPVNVVPRVYAPCRPWR